MAHVAVDGGPYLSPALSRSLIASMRVPNFVTRDAPRGLEILDSDLPTSLFHFIVFGRTFIINFPHDNFRVKQGTRARCEEYTSIEKRKKCFCERVDGLSGSVRAQLMYTQ